MYGSPKATMAVERIYLDWNATAPLQAAAREAMLEALQGVAAGRVVIPPQLNHLLAAALRLVHSGDVPLLTVLRAMTSRPAELLGLDSGRLAVGAPADLIVFDPDFPWVVKEAELLSRSRNTTFEGARMTGAVLHSFVAGKRVFSHSAAPEGS